MSAPIKHTCPDINRLQRIIENVAKEMKNYGQLFEEHCYDIENLASEIYDIGSILEELRTSNSILRDWGYDECKRADDAENKIIELEEIINNLNEK